MVKVFFEDTRGISKELVAAFSSEEYYEQCIDALLEAAKKSNCHLLESVNNDDLEVIDTMPLGKPANTHSYNVGDSDYANQAIQPWEIWEKLLLDPFRADIVKRLLRNKSTDSPVLDMQKIKHICDKIIELYETTDYFDNFPTRKLK